MHAALLAMGCGRGDEVLTPALTPLMCGLAPYYTGAVPVFVDVDQETFLMDPKDLESKITKKTKVGFKLKHLSSFLNEEELIYQILDEIQDDKKKIQSARIEGFEDRFK